MKTSELIKRLQEEDPTGECEVCVGNVDIHFVEKLPAYYDGSLQVLIRDEKDEKECYNIVGARIINRGDKICINTLSIYEALWNDPEMPIDYSDLHEITASRYKESHDKVRKEVVQCEKKIEMRKFVNYVKNKMSIITEDNDGLEEYSQKFFMDNMKNLGNNEKQWDKEIEISYDGFFKIKFFN